MQNAVEATEAASTLSIGARTEDDRVVLVVRDTGPGIAADVAPRIFEPIVTTTTLGLGLGLVTARTLLEGQGGSLVLAETSTRGTTFEVSLPISKE